MRLNDKTRESQRVSNEVSVLLMTIECEEENSWASTVLGLFSTVIYHRLMTSSNQSDRKKSLIFYSNESMTREKFFSLENQSMDTHNTDCRFDSLHTSLFEVQYLEFIRPFNTNLILISKIICSEI